MGNLKPGASYIYEQQDGVVYAREHGTPHTERFPIGWNYEPATNPAKVCGVDRITGNRELDDHNEWIKIRLAGKKNPALQTAIDNVKILYHLSKDNGTE